MQLAYGLAAVIFLATLFLLKINYSGSPAGIAVSTYGAWVYLDGLPLYNRINDAATKIEYTKKPWLKVLALGIIGWLVAIFMIGFVGTMIGVDFGE